MRMTRKTFITVAVCIVVTLFMSSLATSAASPPERLVHFNLMPKVAALPDGTLAAYFIEIRGPGLDPTPPEQSTDSEYPIKFTLDVELPLPPAAVQTASARPQS